MRASRGGRPRGIPGTRSRAPRCRATRTGAGRCHAGRTWTRAPPYLDGEPGTATRAGAGRADSTARTPGHQRCRLTGRSGRCRGAGGACYSPSIGTSTPAIYGGFPMPRLIADRPFLKLTSELGQVMAAAKAREQAGERVMHLERGEPDFETPPHIVEALAAAARAGETHYPDARGSLPLRQALVEKLKRENGIRCEPDDIVVTVGGTHGLFLTFQALLAPGDELLVLSPHWMAIPKLVALAHGARHRTLPAYLDALEGRLAPGALAARLREALAPETRGIYLNTPNNPTGAVLTREQLLEIASVAIE